MERPWFVQSAVACAAGLAAAPAALLMVLLAALWWSIGLLVLWVRDWWRGARQLVPAGPSQDGGRSGKPLVLAFLAVIALLGVGFGILAPEGAFWSHLAVAFVLAALLALGVGEARGRRLAGSAVDP